jgi:hypothetical protein
MTRAEAKASGLTRYFTGKPCGREHISERLTSSGACIECSTLKKSEWKIANPEYEKDKSREFREKKPDKAKEYAKRYYEKNKENLKPTRAKWNEANKGKSGDYTKKWNEENPEKRAISVRKCRVKRMSRPECRINERMSAGMRGTLDSGVSKSRASWQALAGYTVEQLKTHLERQFTKGMNWSNMGEWHIDHILPLSSFTFSAPDDPEFKAAWAITNLRPLWAVKNITKGAKREFLL